MSVLRAKSDFHRSRRNAHPFRDGRRHLLPFPGSFFTGIEANRSGPSRGFSRRCPVPIKPLRMKMIQKMNLRMTKAAPVAAKA
ncbi:hypothetical protein F2Q68_00039633 [Brassica cretica]|uniref:Uncharacterized protein n=1 Tax=Brassica cretica TaxID=69181 RepID=A0A8S9MC41_BRACR|nr:hypothetical protein F2Q68_00039633 [Brassica cretica]